MGANARGLPVALQRRYHGIDQPIDRALFEVVFFCNSKRQRESGAKVVFPALTLRTYEIAEKTDLAQLQNVRLGSECPKLTICCPRL